MTEPMIAVLIPASEHDWVTVRQRRLGPLRANPRTAAEYLRIARWWELEALRAYASSKDSARYARNMRWAAELAALFGPATWPDLLARHANPESVR